MRPQPEIWRDLGQYVHQDFLVQFPDFQSGIEDFLSEVSAAELEELSAFLGEALDSAVSERVLAQVWNSSGAAFFVDDDSGRPMLRMILDVVEAVSRRRRGVVP